MHQFIHEFKVMVPTWFSKAVETVRLRTREPWHEDTVVITKVVLQILVLMGFVSDV